MGNCVIVIIDKYRNGGVLMNNGEYFSSSEVNKTSEYKQFPAEMYKKKIEENSLGNELSGGGNEITTLQKKRRDKGLNQDGSSKTLIDKIFNSVKTVATTATVAVTAVVVTTTLVVNAPKVELKSIDTGSDFVEYEMEISELKADEKYSIVVSTSNEEDIELEIEENGVYKNKVEGLKPQWEYTLSLISRDTSLGDVTHFEVRFQTLKHEEQTPIPPPNTYTGSYTLPSSEDISVNWSNMQLTVPIEFDSVDGKYYYKLLTTDQNGEIIHTESSKDSKNIAIDILEDATEYSLTFEIYGIGEKEEKLISTQSICDYKFAKPSVDITDISLLGENTIRIYFENENAENIDFVISYPDKSEALISATPKDILHGYIDTEVTDTALSIGVTPKINFDGYTLTQGTVNHTFESNLEVEAIVDLYYENVVLFLKYIGNGSDRVSVTSSLDPQNPTVEYIFDGKINLYYEEKTDITYTLYLTNENGDVLSNQVEITVDTSTTVNEDYSFNYINPGDVEVSHNDDGTINLNIPVTFEAENPNIYYKVCLSNNIYVSNEGGIIVTNLPDTIYTLSYYVCIDIDGVCYSFLTVIPSGAINEN